MKSGPVMRIQHKARRLSYSDVDSLAHEALAGARATVVVLDCEGTYETSTAALARLIQLRSRLLHSGRDLRLVGLGGRAADLYEICRLRGLLPVHEATET